MEVRERPGPPGEYEGSGTWWSVLISGWKPRRSKEVATARLQAYVLHWEENWWESLDPTQAVVRGRGEGRELSAGEGGVATITAVFSDCRHSPPRARRSPLRALFPPECRQTSGASGQERSPLPASFLLNVGIPWASSSDICAHQNPHSLRAASFIPMSVVSQHLCAAKCHHPLLCMDHSPVGKTPTEQPTVPLHLVIL